jgi:protoporphyrin/coproporphyrin ferrochelatase
MFEAVLVVSFGGPDCAADVMPFLENVVRGRGVPRERLLRVAQHYYDLGGRSPINDQNRALVSALRDLLQREGPAMPVYWGNRNWHPRLADTVRQMAADGVHRGYAFVTSAYSSYSGCRQYLEDLARACEAVGPGAPELLKLRVFYNHPGFIEPMTERVCEAFAQIPDGHRQTAALLFTAHSIPMWMAETSRYVQQLEEACAMVAARTGRPQYRLVYQSRSGLPEQLWLEPDIRDALRSLAAMPAPPRDVVVVPIGFVSDHVEVLHDLDSEARQLSHQLGLRMVRARTVGSHPRFVEMIRELVLERMGGESPVPTFCAEDCCPPRRK